MLVLSSIVLVPGEPLLCGREQYGLVDEDVFDNIQLFGDCLASKLLALDIENKIFSESMKVQYILQISKRMPPSTIHSTNVLYSIIIFTFQRLLTELLDWNQNVIKIVEFRSYPCIRDCTKICSLKSKLASSNAPNMLPLVQNFGASSFSLFHRILFFNIPIIPFSQYFV